MQLNAKLKGLIANLLFVVALYFGFYEKIIWIQYLTSAFVWVMLFCYLASLLILLKDQDARGALRSKGQGLPKWMTIPFDAAVIAVFFYDGWYGTAAAYLISSFYAIWAYGLVNLMVKKE